jgi:hypothetical protein
VNVRAIAVISCAFAGALASALPARAQEAPLVPGRFELAIGPQWTRGSSFGFRGANETQADGSALALFSTTSELSSAPGLEARIGVRVTRRLELEAIGSYAAPDLAIAASRDTEGAIDVTAKERVQHFTIGGAAIWNLSVKRFSARTIPFLTAGDAYIRQLHDASTLATGGQQIWAGGGVRRLLTVRERRRLKTVGLRGDVRLVVRSKSIALDDRTHVAPALAASFFVRF